MPTYLDHRNWDEGQGVHYEYHSSVPVFAPLTHMLSPDAGWGEDIGIDSRPMQSAQDFIPSEPIVSMIGGTSRGILPMARGSHRATSAGPPNQHITSNPRYTPFVDEALFTPIDCTPAPAPDAGEYETAPQPRHIVSIAAKPQRTGQHRAIQKRSDPHKGSSKISAPYPIKCKWRGCTYSGSFKQESSLIRHLRNFHFDPVAHPCPFDNCNKVCNRGDNLTQHIRNHHCH